MRRVLRMLLLLFLVCPLVDGTITLAHASDVDDEESDEDSEAMSPPPSVEPDNTVGPPAWLASTYIGGGTCLAIGASVGATLGSALCVLAVPCVGLLAVPGFVIGMPIAVGSIGAVTTYKLVRSIARRRVPLMPLVVLGVVIVGAGWLGSMASIAAGIAIEQLALSIVAPPRSGRPTLGLDATTLATSLLAAAATLFFVASAVFPGGLGAAAAATTGVAAVLGREMTPVEDGSGWDLLDVPDVVPPDAEE